MRVNDQASDSSGPDTAGLTSLQSRAARWRRRWRQPAALFEKQERGA
jgi:hypothetical protein